MRVALPLVLLLTAAIQASDSPVRAGFDEPPAIVVNSAERRLSVYVEADENSDLNEIVDPSVGGPCCDGPLPNVIGGSEGSIADGEADQDTHITTFVIYGSARSSPMPTSALARRRRYPPPATRGSSSISTFRWAHPTRSAGP